MWPHVERLLAREPGLRDRERPDELRKYRVATRRLRAAMRLFGQAYPDREVRPLRSGLGDLARTVGAVRDLDLRIADLNRWALERAGNSPHAVAPILEAWGRERSRAEQALERHLDTRRHRRLLESLVEFVDAPTSRETGGGARPVKDRAASRIWAAYEEVRAFGPLLPWADLETLHRLRIETKRLRYALEFLGDILGPQRGLLVERLVALQDHLGALNDAAVNVAAVREFLEDRHATLSADSHATIAEYLNDLERRIARLRRGVGRAWRPVSSTAFARRLSRTVVIA
jgi:CHAD domain-containing protein